MTDAYNACTGNRFRFFTWVGFVHYPHFGHANLWPSHFIQMLTTSVFTTLFWNSSTVISFCCAISLSLSLRFFRHITCWAKRQSWFFIRYFQPYPDAFSQTREQNHIIVLDVEQKYHPESSRIVQCHWSNMHIKRCSIQRATIDIRYYRDDGFRDHTDINKVNTITEFIVDIYFMIILMILFVW